jgi:hypothetical protein
MRPAVLGAIGWLLVVPTLYVTAFDWFSPRNLREAWRGESALIGELDETLACDLVTDSVKANEFARKVSCEGELVSLGDAARLENVVVDKEHRSFCLARAPYWVVLRSTRDMPCFPTPPPDYTRPLESERDRVSATAQAQVKEWAEGIRMAMMSTDRPARCPEIKRARHGVEVPMLEYELLQGSGDPAWAFLTTPWLHEALVNPNANSALKVARRWTEERPWVAVITSASREAPKVLGIAKGWGRGQLTGTISLIDAGAGELICERDFSFRSSDSLGPEQQPTFGKRRINIAPIFDLPTEARVQADFKRRYESAAMRTVNEMTSYGVRTSFY